jgi:hypothetical protein
MRMRMRMKREAAVESKGERRMSILWIWITAVFLLYQQ